MGGGPRRAALAVALTAVFAFGSAPMTASAGAASQAPASAHDGTYLEPQDGHAVIPTPGAHRAANPSRPRTSPHHVQKGASAAHGSAARVVTVTAKPAPKSPARGAASTIGSTGSTSTFGTTNSITSSDQVNFDGLDVAPPDTQIATGPTANVEVVNDLGSITIRDQSPIQTFFDLNYFFLGNSFLTFIVTDPKIVYDASAGRFYMSIAAFDSNFDGLVFLAVSQSSDPTGTWWIYKLLDQSTTQVFCDQPHFGFSTDNIVVSCDNFDGSSQIPTPGYMVISKAYAMAGTAYIYVRFFDPIQGQDHLNLQPVYSMSPTNAPYLSNHLPVEYVIYHDGTGVGVLAVFGSPRTQSVGWMDSFGRLPTAPQSVPPPAAQSGGTRIDSGDFRILSAVLRNNAIWMTSADTCTPAGDTASHACMRINQIDVTGYPLQTRLTQDYDVATTGADLIYPAITLDASGTAYLAFTATSATGYPEFDIADILPATPGQLDQVFQIVGGSASYVGPTLGTGGPYRWGDYSGAAPDPNYAHGVILAGEYATAGNQNNWATLGGTFRVPPCEVAGVSFSQSNPFYPGPAVPMQATATGCWGTPEFRFWKRPPGGAWTIAQDYGVGSGWTWDSSSETVLGTYTFEIDARSQGFIDPYDTLTSFTLTLASPSSCSSAATLNPLSPAATGSTVQVTASSDCPDPIYRFWVRPPGGSWAVARPYAAANTFNWAATGPPGTYSLEVDVKDRLDPSSFYGFPSTLTYQLQACSGATLGASPAPPSRPGAGVLLTAGSSCLGTPNYRFWVKPPGGGWAIKQDFGGANTYSWPTGGLAEGTYGLEVDVRNQGASSSYETVSTTTYLLSTKPCAPSLTPSPPPPGATGAGATFTAGVLDPAGCPNPRFRFWVQPPGGAWSMAQDYGAASMFVWRGGGAQGVYHIEVDARDASESVAYDAVATLAYQLNPCTAAGLTTSLPSGQAPGTAVTVNATATCPGTPAYRFWVRAPGGAWQIKQDYGSSATFSWSTTQQAGTYGLEVDVRNQGSGSGYEAVAGTTFVIGPLPCTTPTLASNVTSPQASGMNGQPLILTAQTSACSNPVYRFWRRPPGGAWTTTGYSTSNTYTDCCFNAGSWSFEVDVKDAASSSSYDGVATIPFEFVPCSAPTLTASPLNAPQGPVLYLQAGAFCPGDISPQFRFWVKSGANGIWTILQDYPIGLNTYMWTIAGHPAGTYYFEVDVRNQSTSVSYETTKVITYQLP